MDYLGGVAAGDLRCDRRIGYGMGGALDREPQLDSRRDRLRVELDEAVRQAVACLSREHVHVRVDDLHRPG
ncbi:MAG: hypothetical protein WKF40_04885 [Thermoleophilaceae bacterium]